ncbi:MAG: 50S ribosomal protein L23 [Candidatus Kerfeldbacteria bacterium RIFCSPHIGHO2_02_FULL_42_14]|uniref:50S ribosomal protein L23 n=1 Tax=Candidatus Kerfeldbacteria bacterium RIFCSPHIGHO2_02_FULL_42_14 TaxID=1798540 RepID=A0A1G2ASP9_9BACT|nr:MAG: 50S ribosomal protein L23 [Candidatus Kerfeldbacteria bacterium RIFCSPHIGHO2_02_FULL_42_14]OGY80483.1 MAG: 50S ribosomal protein L23 [Candidatus Kerfeldbacteria bacterium RIFCSPHIGHO2_12_FULL_42_13]OGY83920.1 MAG: 50S ribosomal protein L23 [Candidatus Kerfeldbacteria bacterium RIFCSPLOWO2_02_FULL_42_19]OGY85328.1 MAG: 50S ribosomal protein L23 [Candidatus Kerfeldbacteria bacterium RIFCSPLOWO2_12_FULL_43_9]
MLLRPLVTEKSEKQKKNNVYFFEVGVGANKIMIKEAIRRVYGVHARRVNVMKRMGKHVRFGRFFGKQKDTKRAMVILKQGQSIEF